MGTTVVVLGASGYAGGETLRLLSGHPGLSVVAAGASMRAGDPIGSAHPHLAATYSETMLPLEAAASIPSDVCISCLPSGILAGLLTRLEARLIVDLSDEFRADPSWTYGLTEHARGAVARADLVANPGCYPTATLLALVPFARLGAIEGPVIVDAMSGVSGAGRAVDDAYLFTSLHDSVAAYGTTEHRHVPEIERGLAAFGGLNVPVSFTPHLVPMARGLLVTCRARLVSGMDDRGAIDVLRQAYQDEYFVDVIDAWPATRDVKGTNRASVSARVDARNGFLIASAAIDNLGKGAAGQAIQNINCALGFAETAGLEQLAVSP